MAAMARARIVKEKVEMVQSQTDDFKIELDDEATNGEIEDDGSGDEPSSGSKAVRKCISFALIKAKSGLTFPPSKVHAAMVTLATVQERGVVKACKVRAKATVCMTAILEYLAAELCQAAGTAAFEQKCSRVEGVHVKRAIRNDEALKMLMSDVRRRIKQTGYEQGRRKKATAAKKAKMKPSQDALADAMLDLIEK